MVNAHRRDTEGAEKLVCPQRGWSFLYKTIKLCSLRLGGKVKTGPGSHDRYTTETRRVPRFYALRASVVLLTRRSRFKRDYSSHCKVQAHCLVAVANLHLFGGQLGDAVRILIVLEAGDRLLLAVAR